MKWFEKSSSFLIAVIFLLLVKVQLGKSWILGRNKHLSPVIFVPGDGGSQMEAKLHKNSVPLFTCAKNSDWYNLWLNLEWLVLPAIYCFVDNIKLHYDNVTRTTHNTQGVDIRIPLWGDPEAVEWIDPTHNKAGAYFKDIANILVNEAGYTRKKNIHGAPYDFRKAPNELHQFFIDLKSLVEYSYELNDRTAITFITHSMGSPLTMVFLRQQASNWKQKYVARIISLAGAWAGSIKALKVYAMGDDLDSFYLNGKLLREEQVSSPSTAFLLPSPLFWGPNEILVQTPNRFYTMHNLETFFNDIDYRTGWEMRKDTLPYTMNFSPPEVELHCLYGDGLRTVERLLYKKDAIVGEVPTLLMGNGDGTVNARSLAACHAWQGYQQSNVTSKALSGINHMDILSHPVVLNYIRELLEIRQ